MKLYRSSEGIYLEEQGRWYRLSRSDWSTLVSRDDLTTYLRELVARLSKIAAPAPGTLLPPIEQGEVWAAGVTYFRSRTARMEEAEAAGGGSFYDRVYEAERPELFFKASPHRVTGDGGEVRIRSDSKWNVPEPELALVVTPTGKLVGYTIGNDMSSRDIEGENPLYLPQAKVYNGSCALGPGILVQNEMLPAETEIKIQVKRDDQSIFAGSTALSQMKRTPAALIEYLYRDNSFPYGCILLTGTGIVPDDSFTLKGGDEIAITIEPIGTLVSRVR